MITRFFAENLGIFPEVSVDLEPLTVFVGPNASGKSTILRGIRTLSMLTRLPVHPHGRDRPLGLARVTTVEHLFGDPEEPLLLGIEATSEKGEGRYSVQLSQNPISDSIEIITEQVRWTDADGETFAYDSDEDTYDFEFRGAQVSADTPRSATLSFLAHPYFREDRKWAAELQPLYDLVDAYSPFHVYRLSPAAISAPADPTANVSYDGQGLAAELDRLLGSKRGVFDDIVEDLKSSFPHIQDVKITTISRGKRGALKTLEIELHGGLTVPAEVESDGVMLTLAYLWLCHNKQVGFGVEEPETGAYPSLLRSRVETLRHLCEGGVQVLMTTQSPVLLTAVGRAEHVRICDRGDATHPPRVYQPPEEWTQDVIYRYLDWAVE